MDKALCICERWKRFASIPHVYAYMHTYIRTYTHIRTQVKRTRDKALCICERWKRFASIPTLVSIMRSWLSLVRVYAVLITVDDMSMCMSSPCADSDSDSGVRAISPARSVRTRTEGSPQRQRYDSDSGLRAVSPARSGRTRAEGSPQRQRYDSDLDMSAAKKGISTQNAAAAVHDSALNKHMTSSQAAVHNSALNIHMMASPQAAPTLQMDDETLLYDAGLHQYLTTHVAQTLRMEDESRVRVLCCFGNQFLVAVHAGHVVDYSQTQTQTQTQTQIHSRVSSPSNAHGPSASPPHSHSPQHTHQIIIESSQSLAATLAQQIQDGQAPAILGHTSRIYGPFSRATSTHLSEAVRRMCVTMGDVRKRRNTEAQCARGWKNTVHDILQDMEDMRHDVASARKSAGTHAVGVSFRRIATCKALEEVAVAARFSAGVLDCSHSSTVMAGDRVRNGHSVRHQTDGYMDRQTDEGMHTHAGRYGGVPPAKSGHHSNNRSTDTVKGTRLEETLRLVRLAHSDEDRTHFIGDAARRSKSAVSTPTSNLAKSVLSNWMARAVEDQDDSDDADEERAPQNKSAAVSSSVRPSFSLDSDYAKYDATARIRQPSPTLYEGSVKPRMSDSDYVKHRMSDSDYVRPAEPSNSEHVKSRIMSDSDHTGAAAHGAKWTDTDRHTNELDHSTCVVAPNTMSSGLERKRGLVYSQDRVQGENSKGSTRPHNNVLLEQSWSLDHVQV
jgi:hypothetical protein